MRIPFTRWPDEFARRYREKGYWQDVPLTDILTRHADSDKTAVIEGERAFSYRQLNQAVDNLACSYAVRASNLAKPLWCNWGMYRNCISPFRPVEAWRSARSGAV